MNNIFNYNNVKNEYVGKDFVIKTISEEELDKLDENRFNETNLSSEKTKPDGLKTAIKYVGFLLMFSLLFLFFYYVKNLEEKIQNVLYIVASVVILIVILIIAFNKDKKEKQKTKKSKNEELKQLGLENVNFDEDYYLFAHLYKKLGVPVESKLISVLSFSFEEVENEIIKSFKKVDYVNQYYRFFIKKNNLYVASDWCLFEISLNDIKKIEKNLDPVKVLDYELKSKLKNSNFKNYSIKKIGFDKFEFGLTYKIIINRNGEEFYFLIPEYEIDKINELIKK